MAFKKKQRNAGIELMNSYRVYGRCFGKRSKRFHKTNHEINLACWEQEPSGRKRIDCLILAQLWEDQEKIKEESPRLSPVEESFLSKPYIDFAMRGKDDLFGIYRTTWDTHSWWLEYNQLMYEPKDSVLTVAPASLEALSLEDAHKLIRFYARLLLAQTYHTRSLEELRCLAHRFLTQKPANLVLERMLITSTPP